MAGQVLARLEAHDNCPSDVEVVLHARYDAKEAKLMRGYYLASPSLRCIFWLEMVFVNKVTYAVRAAMSEAHLGLAVESHFCVLIYILVCHATDASRCVEKYKVDGDSSYHVCAIGHQMEILRYEMFLHYHGEPAVRGSRTESALPEKGRLRVHTYLFKVFSWIFFGMPTLYLKELRKVWVDETVYYDGWRKFTDALKRDWENSITPATVLLSTNVGFLAIQSIDNSPGSVHRSLAQIASYVSAIMSLFNYITVQILSRQHRDYLYETSNATMNFFDRRENQVGLEMVAITISLPTGLFIWRFAPIDSSSLPLTDWV
ncbi:hypothetical protein EW026_g1618 [Hermanssonia centrifuga]|uniref:Uncharacterized protein n=1 Tax=Hermanssonia centrifuga TaxID=98765 RepID=A0A4S4KQS7_9APHY|nr:hypothetical protein EW026_g1618 [Hermanssonia centrifuga]